LIYIECVSSNSSYFYVEISGEKKLTISNCDIILYDYGHSSKSIFKVLKQIDNPIEHEEIAKSLKLINDDFRCSLNNNSLVCIIFGNELINLKKREIDEQTGTGNYKLEIKLQFSQKILDIAFDIISELKTFDKQLGNILNYRSNQLI